MTFILKLSGEIKNENESAHIKIITVFTRYLIHVNKNIILL